MKKLSLKSYLQETFRDERKRKSFLVSVIVFIVVFAGLTAYRQASAEPPGDVIITENGDSAFLQQDEAGATDADAGSAQQASAETRDFNALNDSNSAGDAMIFVDISGAVRTSGLFALPAGSRIADAIEVAGGLTEDADVKYLNRATILKDGDRLYVPTAAETLDGTAPPSAGQVLVTNGGTSGHVGAAQSGDHAGLVNINMADSEGLQQLNGVGPATAQKIIDYRTANGGFNSVEEIMNVSGIGPKTYEKFKERITI